MARAYQRSIRIEFEAPFQAAVLGDTRLRAIATDQLSSFPDPE
jgi:hypothetical protein